MHRGLCSGRSGIEGKGTVLMRSSGGKFAIRLGMAAAAAFAAIQLLSIGVASANAANPNPDTVGAATLNADGTVTAQLSGTWSWPGQLCEGRYGEGYAVDWWGVSASQTPSNPFSLTDATEVSTPG